MALLPNGYLVHVVLALIVVVAAFLVLTWTLRKSGALPGKRQGDLVLASTLSLGGRERIVVVDVSGQQLVLGVSTGQVTLLHTVNAKETQLKFKDALNETTKGPSK